MPDEKNPLEQKFIDLQAWVARLSKENDALKKQIAEHETAIATLTKYSRVPRSR